MANFNVPLLLFVSVLWMLGVGGEGMKFTDDEVALQEPNKAPLEVNLHKISIEPDKQFLALNCD